MKQRRVTLPLEVIALELSKPNFIALLLMSDALSVLGHLSRCSQSATLNLLSVEQILDRALSALQVLKDSPFRGGFMLSMEDTLKEAEITEEIAQEFETIPTFYTVSGSDLSYQMVQQIQLLASALLPIM